MIRETIIQNSSYTRETVIERFKRFEKFEFDGFDDTYLFQVLSYVPFYAGFKAKTVTDRIETIKYYFSDYKKVANYDDAIIDTIMSDPNMIKNRTKINSVIYNAKKVVYLADKYGSFKDYLSQLKFNESEINLERAAQELQNTFKMLGEVTSHHFLTDIGAKTIKPDRVIMRILNRLNLVSNTHAYDEAHSVCNRIVEQTGFSHRYVDIVIVKMGHEEDDLDTGIGQGICLEESPRCNSCLLNPYCSFNKKKSEEVVVNNGANSINYNSCQKPIQQSYVYDYESQSSVYDKQSFLYSAIYKSYNSITKDLIEYLFKMLDDVRVSYRIKPRNDKAIALTLISNYKKNILTIWPKGYGFSILVKNTIDKKCYSIRDIDSKVISSIIDKYKDIL